MFQNKRTALLIVLASLFVSVLGFSILGSTHPVSANNTSLKQQAKNLQTNWEVQQNSKPHAPKGNKDNDNGKPSCPIDLTQAPQIINLNNQSPLPGQNYNSIVNVISLEKVPFAIYGGINAITVNQLPTDPCDADNKHTVYPSSVYVNTTNPGQITLYAVIGDSVLFNTESGIHGRLNYVTGQYEQH